MVQYNIFSPYANDGGGGGGSMEEEMEIDGFYDELKKIVRANMGKIKYIDRNNISGTNSFTYSNTGGKNQEWDLNLSDATGGLFIATLLMYPKKIKSYMVPAHMKKAVDLVKIPGYMVPEFVYLFRDQFEKVFPIVTTRKRKLVMNKNLFKKSTYKTDITVQHPTKRGYSLKYGSDAYKYYYGNIKLKKVIYDKLQNYRFIDYDVDIYCVVSYMNEYLLKKEYNKINEYLCTNPTPTYIELTNILNTIDYNLNVYIIDGENIQKQTEYKKTLNIMIHNEHMYVLQNGNLMYIDHSNTKIINCTTKEYNEIKSEIYTTEYKIYDNKKYKLVNDAFKNIDKVFNFCSFFSSTNYDFFYDCNIRSPSYCSNKYEMHSTLDINKAYYNIMYNKKYNIPKQTGNEKTYKYKNGEIHDIYFYYVEFKTFTHIAKCLFSTKKAWVMGYLINNLKLDIDILYYHTTTENYIEDKKNDFKYIDIIHYSGYLASTIKYHEKTYSCNGIEADAIYTKYNELGHNVSKTKDGIVIHTNTLKQKSGIYAYLGIMQYVRYELYKLYETLKIKCGDDIKICRVKTDSISFNKIITEEEVKQINNILLSDYGFSVKSEYGTKKMWIHKPSEPEEPKIIKTKKNIIKLNEALKDNLSFIYNSKAGLGKTYNIYNKIIPYIQKNNKTYELMTITRKLKDSLNNLHETTECKLINTELQTKESDLNHLIKKYENIDYIIIDEGSLLTPHLIKVLDILKKETNIKIIICGDQHQCGTPEGNGMINNNLKILCDYNYVNLKWSENSRYDKNFYDILNGLLKVHDSQCFKYVKKYFNVLKENDENKNDNKINITWTHKKISDLNKKGINAITIHSIQGSTINEPYNIYETRRLSKSLLYTALSRASNINDITLYE